jgi:hexokinase
LSRRRELLRSALRELCGEEAASRVELQVTPDGSVLGVAHLAAAAAHWDQSQLAAAN